MKTNEGGKACMLRRSVILFFFVTAKYCKLETSFIHL